MEMLNFSGIQVTVKEETDIKGVYKINLLPRGYGHTLANALRRISLSSLPGAGITSVKVQGIKHEYSSMKGVQEDALEVLLNLKDVCFASTSDEPQVCYLEVSGKKKVTAGDIQTTQSVSVKNKDLKIMILTDKNSKVSIELVVESGMGYREADEGLRSEAGRIPLDVDFSPVKLFSFQVGRSRKGQETQLDSVIIEIETDGSVAPREVLIGSAKILQGFAGKVMVSLGIAQEEVELLEEASILQAEEDGVLQEEGLLLTRIEDLSISTRVKTVLMDTGYNVLGDVLKSSLEELKGLPGFGPKSFEELSELLEEYELQLKEE